MINAHKEPAVKESIFDVTAPKKSANLSINSDLLKQAKRYNINLSQTLECYLAEILREEKQREWIKKNRKAVENYNHRVMAQGVFSDGVRNF